jgi:hypothetical protein
LRALLERIRVNLAQREAEPQVAHG